MFGFYKSTVQIHIYIYIMRIIIPYIDIYIYIHDIDAMNQPVQQDGSQLFRVLFAEVFHPFFFLLLHLKALITG